MAPLLPFFPDARIEKGGLVPHLTKDSNGRTTEAYCTLRKNLGIKGTSVDRKLSREVREPHPEFYANDDAGHIIARCLGGSGKHRDNLFPQLKFNNQVQGQLETFISNKKWVSIRFKMVFFYHANETRPNLYLYQMDMYKTKKKPQLSMHFRRC